MTMPRTRKAMKHILTCACAIAALASCKPPALLQKTESEATPASYANASTATDNTVTEKTAKLGVRQFFADSNLSALIDSALSKNQELKITTQEIEIARNEIRARKGAYLPFVGLQAGVGADKPGRYTFRGATEANTNIKGTRKIPDPLTDFMGGAFASWEVDIWRKLRNAKKAAAIRYQATTEGRKFMVTNLVAEIAHNYYELLALDNQMQILRENIEIQSNALLIVRLQKDAARTTELAVRRFEAHVLNTQNKQYAIQQRIIETENRINFLLGRFPQPIVRDKQLFNTLSPTAVSTGLPSQLLENRPDVLRAKQELIAAKVDVKVAAANFYPSLNITAVAGLNAFNPGLFFSAPESILYSIAGGLAGPLVNKNAIKAEYYSANARQTQAVTNYERTLLNAYIEVANQISNIQNLDGSYTTKAKEVDVLIQSITISNNLFRSARADYMEVLLTQRDALESRFELVDTKLQQLNAVVSIYRALGGGWR